MRRIVVTGANKGIGKAIVAAILQQEEDTVVFLGSRSIARGQAARQALLTAHPGWADRLSVLPLDVTDTASVQQAAASVGAPLGALTTPISFMNTPRLKPVPTAFENASLAANRLA